MKHRITYFRPAFELKFSYCWNLIVVSMPSHVIHRVVCENICEFSSEEIDRLVDVEPPRLRRLSLGGVVRRGFVGGLV
jgi:hypothetical protein